MAGIVYSVLGPGGYPRPPYGSFAGKVAPIVQQGNWDTSDPQFYDWWRKRKRELEKVVEEVSEEAPQPLRAETIAAIEPITSIDQLQARAQSLDLLKYERAILQAAIAEYRQMVEDYEREEEEAEFLLLH